MPAPLSLVLDIAPDDLARLKKLPLIRHLGVGRAVTRRTRTVYYDTADLALRRRRLSVHVNQAAHPPGGLPGAPEPPLDGQRDSTLDVSQVNDPALRDALAELPPDSPLQAVFDSTIERTTRLLRPSDDSRIRLELEVGRLRGAAGELPISRLDVGLESGSPRRLFDFVRELQRSVPLRLSTQTDGERGYALVAGAEPRALRAAPIDIDPEMTVDGTLERVIRACLEHLIGNEPAVLDGRLPEGVHQMRVAMRRLRSALSLFRKVLPEAQDRWIRDETRWLAGVLGEARDWDVFLTETLPPAIAALPDQPGFERLRRLAEAERAEAYDGMLEALRSERYAVLLVELRAWLEASGWREQRVSEHSADLFVPIVAVAGRLIEARRRKALKRGSDLGALSAAARHEARKDVKKLRYAFEFFHNLYEGKKVKRFSRDLAKLQDGLGRLNDVETARRLLARLAEREGGHEADAVLAAGLVTGWYAALAERSVGKLDKAWTHLHERKPFWIG
jgi:triphosphatase